MDEANHEKKDDEFLGGECLNYLSVNAQKGYSSNALSVDMDKEEIKFKNGCRIIFKIWDEKEDIIEWKLLDKQGEELTLSKLLTNSIEIELLDLLIDECPVEYRNSEDLNPGYKTGIINHNNKIENNIKMEKEINENSAKLIKENFFNMLNRMDGNKLFLREVDENGQEITEDEDYEPIDYGEYPDDEPSDEQSEEYTEDDAKRFFMDNYDKLELVEQDSFDATGWIDDYTVEGNVSVTLEADGWSFNLYLGAKKCGDDLDIDKDNIPYDEIEYTDPNGDEGSFYYDGKRPAEKMDAPDIDDRKNGFGPQFSAPEMKGFNIRKY